MKYTKKPVTIDAFKWGGGTTEEELAQYPQWFLDNKVIEIISFPEPSIMQIRTLEGNMSAIIGDYIIRGVKGEIYPCKADIFEMTYSVALKDPQEIEVLEPKSTYRVPTFRVTDNGMENGEGALIRFCKGNREDATVPRQEGFFTETLIAASKKYLEENNVGELASREGSMVITKLDEALQWIDKRAKDRAKRGVQGTYKK